LLFLISINNLITISTVYGIPYSNSISSNGGQMVGLGMQIPQIPARFNARIKILTEICCSHITY